jgi:hypothetical protein
MWRSNSGAGRIRAILALAILAALAYVLAKVVPVYVNNYQLSDYLRDVAVRATVDRTNADTLQQEVVTYASTLNLPIAARDVKVNAQAGHVTIVVDYDVPVDLRIYTLHLRFTPSAESRAE